MTPNNTVNPPVAPTGPTGPRTPEGKARTRLNAVRHGLTSREFVFSPEDAELYAQHSTALHQHFQPTNPIEAGLVNSVASGMWRLGRVAAIEEGIFVLSFETGPTADDNPALAPARAWLDNDRSLNLLTTYEQRIRRTIAADKAELSKLQQSRAQVSAEAPSESVYSTQPAPPKPPSPPLPTAASHVVLRESPATPPRRDAAWPDPANSLRRGPCPHTHRARQARSISANQHVPNHFRRIGFVPTNRTHGIEASGVLRSRPPQQSSPSTTASVPANPHIPNHFRRIGFVPTNRAHGIEASGRPPLPASAAGSSPSPAAKCPPTPTSQTTSAELASFRQTAPAASKPPAPSSTPGLRSRFLTVDRREVPANPHIPKHFRKIGFVPTNRLHGLEISGVPGDR